MIAKAIIQQFKTMRSNITFTFAKKSKEFDLEEILGKHKSKDGLEEEIKKYENNKKLDEVRIELKDIIIPKEQLEIQYCRSSGAGGQHLNKTNSKAEIRFNVDSAQWMENETKLRLKKQYAHFITQENYFIVSSQQGRCAHSNLADAIDKLRLMVWECSLPQKERLNLIPAETKEVQKFRIDDKRKKSDVKSTRTIR